MHTILEFSLGSATSYAVLGWMAEIAAPRRFFCVLFDFGFFHPFLAEFVVLYVFFAFSAVFVRFLRILLFFFGFWCFRVFLADFGRFFRILAVWGPKCSRTEVERK